MPREHTFTHAELTDMFPDGIPVSVLLVIERAELAPIAKNAIIREISKEQNPSPAVRYARFQTLRTGHGRFSVEGCVQKGA